MKDRLPCPPPEGLGVAGGAAAAGSEAGDSPCARARHNSWGRGGTGAPDAATTRAAKASVLELRPAAVLSRIRLGPHRGFQIVAVSFTGPCFGG